MTRVSTWGHEIPVYELGPESRIVTRQQLRDPAFLKKVQDGLLDGSVVAADQRGDYISIGGRELCLTDPEALAALAESQAGWVDRETPLTDSLFRATGR